MSTTPAIDLLTPAEASAYLRIGLSTLYEAIKEGRIPAVRLWAGKRKSLWRIRSRDLDRLLEEGAAVPAAPRSVSSRKRPGDPQEA